MNFDFVIVGSGPAGSILSEELSKKGFKIGIIDRAKYERSMPINDFFCPYIDEAPSYYTPVFSNQLGGNSALWHSKIYLLSKNEIQKYNWDIKYEELEKYSNKLASKLKINKQNINKTQQNQDQKYRYSLRAKFRNMYEYLEINKNKNITIFKESSPIKLEINNGVVKKILLKNLKNEKKLITINYSIVFCAGGLGNPHLLLNLLENKNINLGKNLSDHSHVNLGKVINKNLKKYIRIAKPNIKLNSKEKDMNEIALIIDNEKSFSGIQLDYKVDPIRYTRRFFIRIKNLSLKIFIIFLSFFFTKFNGLVQKFGYLIGKYYKYSFEFFFSQQPSLENKVFLTKKKDEFGLKKINISWKVSEDDLKSYNHLIKKAIGQNGILGNFKNKIDFHSNFKKHGLAGLHPSCTTKIGTEPNNGVVDKNLKIFEYDNLYVCGSSVFPFNGYTNPTWTIMSLAFRLANYLENKCKK